MMKKAAIVLALSLSATGVANAAEQVTIMYEVVGTEGETFQTDVPEYNWKSIKVDADKVDETIAELKSDATIGDVEVTQDVKAIPHLDVEPVYPTMKAQGVDAVATFNDPYHDQQQLWADFDPDFQRGNLTINRAMDVYDSSLRMKVGVVDTGFVETGDITYAQGANFYGTRGNAFLETEVDPGCDYRHGTEVAHLAAAESNNNVGMAGIANADVYAARAGGCGGSFPTNDVADAILWLSGETIANVSTLAEPVDVINLSLGGKHECYAATQAAIDVARSRGVVITVAGGNSADDVALYAPANCEGVVTVGANNFLGQKASFTNDGEEIDVFATGQSVLTAQNPGSYVRASGTSMSAPIVAGHVALIKAVEPEADERRIVSLLTSSQRKIVSGDTTLPGAGIMDSLKLAKSLTGETYVARPMTHALDHEQRIANEAAYTQAAANLNTCNLYEVDTTKMDITRASGEYFKVFEVSKAADFTVTNGTEVSSSQGTRVLIKNVDPNANSYGLSVCNADNSACDSEIPVNLNASESFTSVYCS